MPSVQHHISYFLDLWDKSPVTFPVIEKVYSESMQQQREQNFMQLQQQLKKLQSKGRSALANGDPSAKFFPAFKNFLQNVFDYETEQLDIILSDEFKDVSKDFYYQARDFDPDLSPDDIYQGLRNVWIMNGIQLMMQLPVEITPSIFGYSMIYPYSDNFLDSATVSMHEKSNFSKRFCQRLHGDKLFPENRIENILFKLVEMMELQYPRDEFPGVFNSLYAIQQGQTNSLKLMNHNGLTQPDKLTICFEKGGASVMADGYLVAGRLTPDQERALFGYGIYLQLLDDIQDISEDRNAGNFTLFSGYSQTTIDELVNKTFHFGRAAMEHMKCFGLKNEDVFLNLMNHSIEMMLIESAGLSPEHYSPEWLNALEKHSPLRFPFIRAKREQSRSQRLAMFRNYFSKKAEAFNV